MAETEIEKKTHVGREAAAGFLRKEASNLRRRSRK
jgi:hypothetical protein